MIGEIEKEKRVYQISLLLRRKPVSYILEYIIKNWGVEQAQAYNYIREAKKEWAKYFKNIKRAGVGYHIAQFRDIKDQAYIDKDSRLVFDIAKEEAKIMSAYPPTKSINEVTGKDGSPINVNFIIKMDDE